MLCFINCTTTRNNPTCFVMLGHHYGEYVLRFVFVFVLAFCICTSNRQKPQDTVHKTQAAAAATAAATCLSIAATNTVCHGKTTISATHHCNSCLILRIKQLPDFRCPSLPFLHGNNGRYATPTDVPPWLTPLLPHQIGKLRLRLVLLLPVLGYCVLWPMPI